MTRSAAARRWAGRAVALRPADLRALVWTHRALRALRPELAAHGTRAQVVPAPAGVAGYAVRAVALYLRLRRASCFERTLILQRWLTTHGTPVTIAIGVSTDGGFSAHAWLVDLDPPAESEGYEEITRVEP